MSSADAGRRLPVRAMLALAAMFAMVFALVPLAGVADADHADPDEVCPPPEDYAEEDVDFEDHEGTTHEDTIECVAQYGIAQGFADGTFRPADDIHRDQMATFIAEKVEIALGGEALDDSDAPFLDVAPGNPHRPNINKLYNAGIVEGTTVTTYGPKEPVLRGQMATFVANAIDYVDNEQVDGSQPPAATADHFDDTDGHTHEDNINRLAEQHIVFGVTGQAYEPNETTQRGAMASFIMRGAGYLDEIDAWEPPLLATNQEFAVTPRDLRPLPEGEERDFTANVREAGLEVELGLVECANVTVVDRHATFEVEEDNGDHTVVLYDGEDARFTEIQGVSQPDDTTRATADADGDGIVAFTIQGEEDVCVVPVVWEDVDGDGALDATADGDPTEPFGVGGPTQFSDVEEVVMDPETAVNRVGTQHTVTATLASGPDIDNGDVIVPLNDQEIEFIVAEVPDQQFCDGLTPQTVALASVVETSTEPTSNGVATFTYTGPDEEAEHCILADWEGTGDYEGQDEFGVAHKEWSEDDPEASEVEVSPQSDSNLVGTSHTIEAEVTDQFGDPAGGETVRFTIYTDELPDGTYGSQADATTAINGHVWNVTRTTGSDGVATFTYAGPAASTDHAIIACLGDDTAHGDTCFTVTEDNGDWVVEPVDASDDAEKFWAEEADSAGQLDGDILGFDTDEQWADIKLDAAGGGFAEGDNVRVFWDSDDSFEFNGVPILQQFFEGAIDDDHRLEVDYDPAEAEESTFNLDTT